MPRFRLYFGQFQATAKRGGEGPGRRFVGSFSVGGPTGRQYIGSTGRGAANESRTENQKQTEEKNPCST